MTAQLTIRAESLATRGVELPSWPVTGLLWGLPLWWVTGLFPWAPLLLAAPMLALLLRAERLVWVPGVLPWFAFLAWTVPSAFMLPGAFGGLGFLLRFAQFAAVGVLLVYVVNARSLSRSRVLRALCVSWAATVVGGYLGLLWPYGRLTVTLGSLLPTALAKNAYVHDLMFPPFAEVQHPPGSLETLFRPSAPYAYTNGWGAAMALLTPVVVAELVRRRSLGSMLLGGLALAAALPPAVATTNRGLFLTLAVVVVYVLVRLALQGQASAVLVTGGVLLLAVWGLLHLGLGTAVASRQEAANTSQGRSLLYQETFRRALGSPFVGFGAPRASDSSEINVGTQGMFWNVMFCFGFVGLALFLWFLLTITIRTRATSDTVQLWLHSVLVGSCVMELYYGMDRQLIYVAVVGGLLLRERYMAADPPPGARAGLPRDA